MVLQHLGGHESWGPYEPPGPLCGSKLADAVVRELHVDRFQSKACRGWKRVLWIRELPHEDVVALEVTVDDSTGVEILDGCSCLRGGCRGEKIYSLYIHLTNKQFHRLRKPTN